MTPKIWWVKYLYTYVKSWWYVSLFGGTSRSEIADGTKDHIDGYLLDRGTKRNTKRKTIGTIPHNR